MDAAEAAVAQHGDDITGLRFSRDVADDRLKVRQVGAVAAKTLDVRRELRGIQPVVLRELVEVRNRGDHGEIGGGQRFGQLVLEDGAAGGVRAGLEEHPHA